MWYGCTLASEEAFRKEGVCTGECVCVVAAIIGALFHVCLDDVRAKLCFGRKSGDARAGTDEPSSRFSSDDLERIGPLANIHNTLACV